MFIFTDWIEGPRVRIEFLEGSLGAHPNFERYLDESTSDGAVPLRFDRVVRATEAPPTLAAEALTRLEQLAAEEAADILPSTLVATWAPASPGSRRHQALVIARKRRPSMDRVVVRVELDP